MVADSAVALELAVLHSLGQLGFATTEHLHALCFPDAASSTVRVRLAALRSAGCIQLTPWRLPRVCQERGSVWTLTPMGGAYLQAYGIRVDGLPVRDLGVPSTALERDEWRVRMAVRSFVVRLVLQARIHPTFADLRAQLRACWPTPYAPPPGWADADLMIVWSPEAIQRWDWLPWRTATPVDTGATRYVVVIDRPWTAQSPNGVVDVALERARHVAATAVLIWESAERQQQSLHQLAADAYAQAPLRMTTQALIARGLDGEGWRDAYGRRCSLRPQVEEVRGYHAPAVA